MKLQRIVVTNDDGIEAPGLAVAEAVAQTLAEEVWVFAPATDQSGTAQALSMHHPLRVHARGARRFAVTGTPADCVMVALGTELMAGTRPDLLLSGVNWGHNLSDSVMYSGTVGAALAAAQFQCPAIALSQAFRAPEAFDFAVARAWAAPVIERLWAVRAQFGFLWNINFPSENAISGLRFTRQVCGSMRAPRLLEKTDARGQSYRWIAFERGLDAVSDPHADAVALREGFISATPLRNERHHDVCLDAVGAGAEWSLAAMEASR